MPQTLDPADLKTMRLASPGLSREQVAKMVRYLERVLERGGGDPLAGAQVRQQALEEVGLSSAELSRVTPLLTEFCGRRWTARTLAARLEALKEKEKVALLSVKERGLLEKLPAELRKSEDLSAFEARHGAETLAVLREEEARLLALHEKLRGAF